MSGKKIRKVSLSKVSFGYGNSSNRIFKKGTQIEVIDGRQRFETLKRFREDNFSLYASGLMDLKALAGKNIVRLALSLNRFSMIQKFVFSNLK